MTVDFKWSRLADFDALEVHQIIKAREAVFVVEQDCAYQETDDWDLQAWHLTGSVDGELAAYARVIGPDTQNRQASIGRVMTPIKFRGQGRGRALMEEAIKFIHNTYPGHDIKISAQVYLTSFYASLGFDACGEAYEEDGIPHIAMIKLMQK
jgi:ElaA protein